MPRWALTLALSLVVACSLTTSLDGFSGGPAPAPDGGEAGASSGSSGSSGSSSGSSGSSGADAADGNTTASSLYAKTILADQPVGYWRFGEASGTSALDQTHHVDGLYVAGVTLGVPGALANDPDTAASFDGVAALVSFGNAYEFRGNAPFSIEAWVEPKIKDANIHRIASRRTNDGNGYRFMLDTNNVLTFERWIAGAKVGTVGPEIPIDVYTHVVATYDGAKQTIYRDGAAVGSNTDATALQATDFGFVVGASSNQMIDFFFGAIDEVAIYDVALTPAQVAAHHAAGR